MGCSASSRFSKDQGWPSKPLVLAISLCLKQLADIFIAVVNRAVLHSILVSEALESRTTLRMITAALK